MLAYQGLELVQLVHVDGWWIEVEIVWVSSDRWAMTRTAAKIEFLLSVTGTRSVGRTTTIGVRRCFWRVWGEYRRGWCERWREPGLRGGSSWSWSWWRCERALSTVWWRGERGLAWSGWIMSGTIWTPAVSRWSCGFGNGCSSATGTW